jgi:glycosyltransferase involved in cell wall biosynthesis
MSSDVTAIVTCMTDTEKPFIRETLQSVRDQTLPCETILVVLDSNSWISEVVKEFPTVRILRRELGPLGAVRNSGIVAAKTEFVAFLDGDDVWLPSKLEYQMARISKGDCDLVGVDHLLMTEQGQVFAYALARNIPMPSSWLVRRESMLCHSFDPDLPMNEDGAWWLATWATVRKRRLAKPLIKYRVRQTSLSETAPSKRRKLALAKLSTFPMARTVLLSSTFLLHSISRRQYYAPSKAWRLPKNS